MKLIKEIKNKWGRFIADDSNGHLMLLTNYTSPNRKKEVAWRIDMSLKHFPKNNKDSYDGIMVTIIKEDKTFKTTHLEIAANQLEALREHLNKWHEENNQ